jgi:hypothetical protein
MATKSAVENQYSEVEWFTAHLAKVKRSRKYDAATKATLIASYEGGLRSAKAELARLQSEKCRIESAQCTKEYFNSKKVK